ncbi:MAG: hypothetical protein AABZ74_00790 [Cyanobacteriota bacterium]|mgnify:CR=1 FL=1
MINQKIVLKFSDRIKEIRARIHYKENSNLIKKNVDKDKTLRSINNITV